MKNFLFTILLITFALFGSQSCGKDADEFIPVNTKIDTIQTAKKETDWQDLLKINDVSTKIVPQLNIEKLMADLASEPSEQELSNAERGGKITTPDNVTIEIPANSFTKGSRFFTGELKLEILVLRKKGEFLLNNIPTVSDGKQLILGGVVLVRIKQDDAEIKFVRTNSTMFKVKFQPATTVEEGMKLFEGKKEGRFKFDWKLISTRATATPTLKTWAEMMQGRPTTGYEMLVDTFNLMNCGKFSGDTTNLTSKFCVALPDSFTNQNCSVFAVFKDINSVVALKGDQTLKQFCLPSNYKGLPIGKVINIVSIAMIKDRIYLDKTEVTISANTSIRVVPTSRTKTALKELISNL